MNALAAYVDDQVDNLLEDLMRILRQPSVAAQHWGMEESAALVADRLRRLGATVHLMEPATPKAPPILFAELGSGDKTLLLYNHYDVAPPEPLDRWESNPFEPVIRDGKLYARGVSDNKGNLMARVHAIEAWLATEGALPLKIKWVIEGEEEVGSPHLAEWVREHRALLDGADGCLWEFGYKDIEGRPVINLGSKGLYYVELHARGAERDLHSSMAAIVPNPAWRLAHALTTLKDADETILIDGFMDLVAPPPLAARRLLEQLPFEEGRLKEDYGIPAFIGDLSGIPLLEKLLYQPTCTICGLMAGYTGPGSKTVLPSHAVAKLDFRLVYNLTPERAHDLLRAHLDRRGFTDIEIVPISQSYPAQTDPASPFVQTVIAATRATCQEPPVVRPISAGSSPMYTFTEVLDVPIAALGVGYAGSNQHAPNENIRVVDYIEGVKCVAELIRQMVM